MGRQKKGEFGFGVDNKEVIEMCLNCIRPRCNNCVEYNERAAKAEYRCGYVQLDKYTGDLIAVYETATEAMKKTGIRTSSIYGCVNGQLYTAGGFVWKRQKDYELLHGGVKA